MDKCQSGGHFAAAEEPELLASDLQVSSAAYAPENLSELLNLGITSGSERPYRANLHH